MKKFYALLLAGLCSVGLYAQGPKYVKKADCELPEMGNSNKVVVVDTIQDYLFRASGAVMYGSQDGGYVMGTGYYDNQGTLVAISEATANHYDAVGSARVTEILAWFGDVTITGAADNVTGNVYAVNADTTPGVLLGMGTVTTADLVGSTSFVYSSIPITTGSGDTGGNPFLISIDYTGADDTLGLVSSNPDSADGMGEKRTRQRTTATFGGSWVSIETLWGPFDCDAFIVPVIDDSPVTGVSEAVNAKGLTLGGNYPNPSNGISTIRFSIDKPQEVKIKVFDLAAREVLNTGWVELEAGEQEVQVDVSEAPAGAYYYTISTHETSLTSRLHVVR